MPDGMVYSTEENFVQPILQYDGESKLWRLKESYYFEWGKEGFRKRLYMAPGFEYDKASVPRLFWPIARPDGPWEAAALFHDRLYRDKGKFPHPNQFRFETLIQPEINVRPLWVSDLSAWTRKDADDLLELMGKLGGAKFPGVYKWAVKLFPPNWFKGF